MDRDKESIFGEGERIIVKGQGKYKLFDGKKQSRAASIKSKKTAAQETQREISSLKPSARNLKKKGAQER